MQIYTEHWLLAATVARVTETKDGKIAKTHTLKPYDKVFPTNISY